MICDRCGEEPTLFMARVKGSMPQRLEHSCELALRRRVDLLERTCGALVHELEVLKTTVGGMFG